MINFTKIEAIRAHLQIGHRADVVEVIPPAAAPETGKRVQKNLSILELDAERLAALDAYECKAQNHK